MSKPSSKSTVLILQVEFDTPLPCVVQDPAYSELEKVYLRLLDLEVVDDPDAYSRIDADSLVFYFGGYFEFAWWIAEGLWPAVMITNDWGNPRPVLVDMYPAYYATFVHYMFQHYDHEPFAVSADGSVSCGENINVYWRRPSNFSLSLEQHGFDAYSICS